MASLRAGSTTSLLLHGLALASTFWRVRDGHHYPTDVLGGVAIGVTLGLAGRTVGRRLDSRRGRRGNPKDSAHFEF